LDSAFEELDMKRLSWLAVLALAACGTPGREVLPEPGDFAFLEVRLKG
jgi:hypothetical protein